MERLSDRARNACQAKEVHLGGFPGYPDPSTATGWADIPTALIAADLTGREDVEYTAMIERSVLTVDDATLAVSREVDGGWIWLLGLEPRHNLRRLDIVGVADLGMAQIFASVEPLAITTTQRMTKANGQPGVILLSSNDAARWQSIVDRHP